jgi:hypothetical protein
MVAQAVEQDLAVRHRLSAETEHLDKVTKAQMSKAAGQVAAVVVLIRRPLHRRAESASQALTIPSLAIFQMVELATAQAVTETFLQLPGLIAHGADVVAGTLLAQLELLESYRFAM